MTNLTPAQRQTLLGYYADFEIARIFEHIANESNEEYLSKAWHQAGVLGLSKIADAIDLQLKGISDDRTEILDIY